MVEEKFDKLSVKESVKREFGIIAGAEGRNVYRVVADALKVYKAVTYGKRPIKSKKIEKIEAVELSDIVSAQFE
jgi:hypothetical protein